MPDPAATTATTATATLPPTCNVVGWLIFGPGPHKDGADYYSPAMCARIPANFRRLAGHTTPRAKIGHDAEQVVAGRLQKSMGFLSVGTVTRCDPVAGYPGYVEIDVRGVPTRAVGGEIEAGRLNSGSVELLPSVLDPDDPSRRIEGPILTGVSFLGEEQPAVRNFPAELRDRARPRATFDDGSPVPPNDGPPPEWLSAMAGASVSLMAAAARPTATVGGRQYAATVICFSEMSPSPNPSGPMTPEQESALTAAGFTPEQIASMKTALAAPPAPGTAPPVAMAAPPTPAPDAGKMVPDTDGDLMASCAKFADDPAATPEQKLMGAMAKKFADQEKRIGAFEAAAEAVQKKDDETKAAAFSDKVDSACKRFEKKVEPAVIAAVHRPTLLGILTSKTFAAEADRVKTFSDYVARLEALPDDPRLATTPRAAAPGGGTALTDLQARMLNSESMRRYAPDVRARLLPAAAK